LTQVEQLSMTWHSESAKNQTENYFTISLTLIIRKNFTANFWKCFALKNLKISYFMDEKAC